MAARANRSSDQRRAPAPRRSAASLRLATPGPAGRSPAREMQSQLAADLAREGRWPPAVTLAFITATCGGFWAAVAWGVSKLVH